MTDDKLRPGSIHYVDQNCDGPFQELLKVARLNSRRKVLIDYLHAKADEEDWHGVADAACDLRVLDAQIQACAP